MIDSQQRLATLTLLVIVLRDHISEIGWSENDRLTADQPDGVFLKDRHDRASRKYKLSLRRTDNATLYALVNGKALDTLEGSPFGQIVGARKFFQRPVNAL